MGQKRQFNPLVKDYLDLVGDADAFFTVDSTGVKTITWSSTPGSLKYIMTVDDSGAVVTTLVVSTLDQMIGAGPMFGLTYNA